MKTSVLKCLNRSVSESMTRQFVYKISKWLFAPLYKVTVIHGLGRTVDSFFLKKKSAAIHGRNIEKRVKEVPESDEKVCWETDLVLGYEGQDRGGARVCCSFTDTVAVMLYSHVCEHRFIFTRIF